jgi:hypothetical protein
MNAIVIYQSGQSEVAIWGREDAQCPAIDRIKS